MKYASLWIFILALLSIVGCMESTDRKRLIGEWETEVLHTEWGEMVMVLVMQSRGDASFRAYTPDRSGAIVGEEYTGRYEIEDDNITFEDILGPGKFSFEVSDSRLRLYHEGDLIYEFFRSNGP